ncbi:hypothetical protein HU200_048717 [Digitaria exilis]|uniref:Uncharacterized protein n=1 Tax=Digitaria exilis TaxID=1010633 RepID=A0A835AWW0_9POAL|nr:hypothetical protein HU200_048717 [Digitaria exilis]CAB3490184.1 unnamed protein product [Digitaria exilis]
MGIPFVSGKKRNTEHIITMIHPVNKKSHAFIQHSMMRNSCGTKDETISSGVAQEAFHHVLSKLMESYKHSSDAKDHMERMEMAQIRLEAALEESQRWSVTSVPLLRWQNKLKRAAQECDHTLRRCRRRVQEEEEERSSLPSRVARFAMSFVTSIMGGGGDDELEGSVVCRFERFADGASEFLRYVELGGGTPRQFMFSDGALVRHLLEGKGTKNCFVDGGQSLSFILQPFILPGHGMEAALLLLLEDDNSPENNFLLTLSLRLSESTDIVGSVVRCLELFTPYLSSTTEAAKTKLTQLPTQDLLWVPYAHSVYGHDEPGDNLDIIFAKQARPNPLCCQQVYQSDSMQRHVPSSSTALREPLLSDI